MGRSGWGHTKAKDRSEVFETEHPRSSTEFCRAATLKIKLGHRGAKHARKKSHQPRLSSLGVNRAAPGRGLIVSGYSGSQIAPYPGPLTRAKCDW
jgi:hypothetical protein